MTVTTLTQAQVQEIARFRDLAHDRDRAMDSTLYDIRLRAATIMTHIEAMDFGLAKAELEHLTDEDTLDRIFTNHVRANINARKAR